MIYVKDAAEAIIRCIQSEKSHNKAYNLSAPEVLTYRTFLDELHNASDVDFTEQNVTVARSLTARIPFPFPLTEAESELFDGSKLTDELSLTYTPFSEAPPATISHFLVAFFMVDTSLFYQSLLWRTSLFKAHPTTRGFRSLWGQ